MNQLWEYARVTLSDLFTTYPYPYILASTAVAGFSLYLLRWYLGGGVCYSKAILNGKTAIITGANTGIGLETAVDFAKRNGRVILACRNKEKGEAAVVQVKKRSGNENVVFVQLDLSSLESVRAFSSKVLASEPRIDILVNNAGMMGCPYAKTVDGFETTFGVNHLAPFLLTNLLLGRLKEAPSARIVNVSALLYRLGKINFDDLNSEQSYSAFAAYNQSKLANILFTRSLAQRLEGTKVTVNTLHPGVIRTDLGRQHRNFLLNFLLEPVKYLFLKTAWQGAQTTIYCAVSEEMEGVSGQYLSDCKIKKLANPQATDDSIAERLWEVSMQMVGLEEEQ